MSVLLPGRDAEERAALFLALIAGFQLMRKVIGNAALAKADTQRLSKRFAGLFQSLVDQDNR